MTADRRIGPTEAEALRSLYTNRPLISAIGVCAKCGVDDVRTRPLGPKFLWLCDACYDAAPADCPKCHGKGTVSLHGVTDRIMCGDSRGRGVASDD